MKLTGFQQATGNLALVLDDGSEGAFVPGAAPQPTFQGFLLSACHKYGYVALAEPLEIDQSQLEALSVAAAKGKLAAGGRQ